jgi:folate-binding protein YgfZ
MMINTAEQVRTLPLEQMHLQLGAKIVERDGWRVPVSYGDSVKEYEAVSEHGAGLIDLSARGRILVSGSEAIQFLNGLITNDMKTLAEHSWMPAAFPNVQGRLIASVRVIRLQDAGGKPAFLLDTEPATLQQVLKTIERFTLAGDFSVSDITAETAQLSIQGRRAAAILQSVLGKQAGALALNGATKVRWAETEVILITSAHTPEGGFDLVLNSKQADDLWRVLENAGARPFGYDALEILRVEAGVPRFAIDMDETNVVSETNLDDSVSYSKGCYVGQEIIARIKYRGHVAKKLTGISWESANTVDAGSVVKSSDDKEIGRITSAVYSPRLKSTIALAYVKYDHLKPDTPVRVVTSRGEVTGRVTTLPFVASTPESKE